MIPQLLGGVGLFLLGMVLLTDGLKAAAGDALRDALGRVTGGTGRAVVTGMGFTALVQSSSATVLTTIGFVSAGLLAFPQALGVILGANLGTTSTGWLVAVLGLRLSIGMEEELDREAASLEALSRRLASRRRAHRREVLARTAAGEVDPDRVLALLEAMRWLDAAVYHLWRATVHLAAARKGRQADPPGAAVELERPA